MPMESVSEPGSAATNSATRLYCLPHGLPPFGSLEQGGRGNLGVAPSYRILNHCRSQFPPALPGTTSFGHLLIWMADCLYAASAASKALSASTTGSVSTAGIGAKCSAAT
jgi:hypothetical protein